MFIMKLLIFPVAEKHKYNKSNDKEKSEDPLTGTKHKFVVLQLQKYKFEMMQYTSVIFH